jgi:hypothetical protein
LCQYYLTGQHGKFTYEPDESLTLPGEQLRSNLVLLVTYILLAWTFILLFPLFPFPNWGKFIIIGGMGVVMVDQLTGAKILAQFMLNRIKKDETYFVESRYEELGEMVTAEQAAWTVLLEAFKLIGGELKQRWEFARKKEDEQEANEQQYEPGVAEDLANAIKSNLNLVEESQLRMLTNDLETAIKLAQGFNKKRNLYREQLPNAIDIVPIRIQIDEAEGERDKAVVEIKEILEKMAGENIVTNASMV